MTKKNTTKRALFASVLSLLLCVSMLIGSTFAWFTDTSSTGVNTIQSGNLDIVLSYKNATQETWKEVSEADKLFNDAALWEPGYTEVAYLKIENSGSLALKYQLTVNVLNEVTGTNKDDGTIKLSEVLKYDLIELTGDTTYADRAAALAAVSNAKNLATETVSGTMEAKATAKYFALVVYMPTTVGNEANHNGTDKPSIQLGVNVFATQYTSENDSYGSDYDADATFAAPVTTADELYAAINKGEAVVMMNDITLNGGDNEYLGTAESKVISIDGNGHTITFNNGTGDYAFTILRTTNSDAVLSISNAKITRTDNAIGHYHSFLTFACNTNLTNVELDQSITLNSSRTTPYTYNLNNVTINDTRTDSEHYAMFIVGGQTVNMQGCKISVAGSGDRAIKIVDENADCLKAANLTISNTSFKSGKKAAVLVGSQYGANIVLSNVDISAVAADTTNAVWVDSNYSAYAEQVVVTGGTKFVEN